MNGDSVMVQATADSQNKARNLLRERCQERLGGSDTGNLKVTSQISILMERWYDTTANRKPQSRDRYRTAIDKHIIPGFGKMQINQVAPWFLQEWINAQTQGTVGNIHTVLNQAFRMAVRYGVISTNPLDAVDKPKATPKEVRALQGEEIQDFRDLMRATKNETLIDVTDFSITTGLRAGEVLGIRWSDIDMKAEVPTLRLSGQVVYSKEGGHTRQETGKSDAAKRPIQLSTVALEIVERRREKYGELEMVFPSGAGSYIWENNFNRWLRAARGEKFKWVTIHVLRKTFSSIIADALGPHKAADVLGHSDSRLTEKVYYERNRMGVPIGNVIDEVVSPRKTHE
ncbi:MAG: site-specific integrase [Corynebacterium glutamicum]|nr:site-specific integrase [Corynebacterium glutamicum]